MDICSSILLDESQVSLDIPSFQSEIPPSYDDLLQPFFSTIKTSMTKKPFDVEINPSSFFSFLFGFFCIII